MHSHAAQVLNLLNLTETGIRVESRNQVISTISVFRKPSFHRKPAGNGAGCQRADCAHFAEHIILNFRRRTILQPIKNIGVYHALVAQLDKLARHNRQGSFRTKERYYEAYKRFCAFLASEFHLQMLNKARCARCRSARMWRC